VKYLTLKSATYNSIARILFLRHRPIAFLTS